MSASEVETIRKFIGDSISKKNTEMRQAIPVEDRVTYHNKDL